jgi:hypothetical protein
LKQIRQSDSGVWIKIDEYRCRRAFRHFIDLLKSTERHFGGTENVFVYYERLASETENPPSLAGTAIRRQTLKVGAACLNWARTPNFTPKAKMVPFRREQRCEHPGQGFLATAR